MSFSESTIRRAWTSIVSVCECSGDRHGHQRRCTTRLLWTRRAAVKIIRDVLAVVAFIASLYLLIRQIVGRS
jgi:hypothetical protein